MFGYSTMRLTNITYCSMVMQKCITHKYIFLSFFIQWNIILKFVYHSEVIEFELISLLHFFQNFSRYTLQLLNMCCVCWPSENVCREHLVTHVICHLVNFMAMEPSLSQLLYQIVAPVILSEVKIMHCFQSCWLFHVHW